MSRVCDAAPRLTEPRGRVAERRAAAPRSPRRLPRHRSTYALLYEVTLSGTKGKFRGTRDIDIARMPFVFAAGKVRVSISAARVLIKEIEVQELDDHSSSRKSLEGT